MPGSKETPVLVVGGGPVGMTLAMDLAWRGIDCRGAETRRVSRIHAFVSKAIRSRFIKKVGKGWAQNSPTLDNDLDVPDRSRF
jgi:flavin-dependent dehydrogenase